MKLKKTLLPLLSLTLLASCTKTTADSASQVVSAERQGYQFRKSTTGIYDALMHIAENNDYRLTYDIEGQDYYDVYTQNYFYMNVSRTGGVLLDYYDDETFDGSVLYGFDVDNNNQLHLGSVLSDKTGPVTSTQSTNYLQYFLNEKTGLKEEHIQVSDDGVFYTTDVLAIYILSSITGRGTEALNNVYNQVVFSFDPLDKGKLGFSIQGLSLDGTQKEVEYVKASFSDVDIAQEPIVEKFVNDFRLSDESLTESQMSSLTGSSLRATSKIDVLVGKEPARLALTQTVSYTDTQLSIHGENALDNTVSDTQFVKGINGNAMEVGIDYTNAVAYNDMGVAWNKLTFPKDVLDNNAFRKTGENTYHYFGMGTGAIFYSLTYLSLGVRSLDIVVNGIDLTLLAKTGTDTDEDYNAYHYEITTTFSNDVSIPAMTPFVHQDENDAIKESLDLLTSGHKFRYNAYDYSGNTSHTTDVIVDMDIVYFNVTQDSDTVRFGYYEKNGALIAFDVNTVDNRNVVTKDDDGTKEVEGMTLNDVIHMDISADVLTINAAGDYVTKSNVINIQDHVIAGPDSDYMMPSSLTMKVNADRQITALSYIYSRGNTNGYDMVRINEYGTASVSPILAADIRALEA